MSIKECSSLLMWSGALHDIAENLDKNKQPAANQIRVVEKQIEDLALKYFPELKEPFVIH